MPSLTGFLNWLGHSNTEYMEGVNVAFQLLQTKAAAAMSDRSKKLATIDMISGMSISLLEGMRRGVDENGVEA